MALEVRKATRADLKDVTDLWYELAVMHEDLVFGYDLSRDAKEAWKEFVEDGFKRKNMCTYVAEEDDELIGFLNVVIRERLDIFKETKIGMILDVFVKEERRGEGIGSLLVKRAEEWFEKKGVKSAVLTVSPNNEKAVEFWEEKGYETYLLKKRAKLD